MSKIFSVVQIARFIISFSWIYHGVFPKLIHIAPTEKLLMSSLGFSEAVSLVLIRCAGVGELIFGILIFVLYRLKWLIMANILALVALLGFVAYVEPQLLIAAFNPVSSNIALIGLSVILLQENKLRMQ